MNMIEALNEAIGMYCRLHDIYVGYAQEKEGCDFYYTDALEYAQLAEAIGKAIDFIESHGLLDKAAQMRYTALEMANDKIAELEKELEEIKRRS